MKKAIRQRFAYDWEFKPIWAKARQPLQYFNSKKTTPPSELTTYRSPYVALRILSAKIVELNFWIF